MEVQKARRSRVREQRQVVLLGAIALLAVLVVGAFGAVRSRHVGERLDRVGSELHVPRTHLRSVEVGLAALLLSSQAMTGRMTTGSSAALGAEYESMRASWEDYVGSAAGLPGEAELSASLRTAFELGGSLFTESTTSDDMPIDPAVLAAQGSQVIGETHELAELYDRAIADAEAHAVGASADVARTTLGMTLAAVLLLGLPFATFARATRRRARATSRLEAERDRDACRTDFEARLQRAFDMVRTEESACAVVGDAAALVLPERRVELLLADSSRAHLREAALALPGGCDHGGCGVGSPMECPAATRGQTQEFTSSEAIDACPFLKGRPEGEIGATCVPVSIAGKTIGVLHSPAAPGERLDDEGLVRLELLARKAGDRLGMLRAFVRSETQARTDPLTGLVNRRSLEEDVRALVEEGRPYVVAYADLDRFKQLNDVHGHDTGDRALRLFARVLRDSVRPVDLPARYGGEEFVVVLPDCTLGDAEAVVERVRARLAEAVGRGSVPAFTCSVGLAASTEDQPFPQVVELADGALLVAKAAGRDRTVVAGSPPPNDLDRVLV